MSLYDYAVLSFSSIFVIVDPIALVPSFMAMTVGHTVQDRTRISGLAATITCAILLFFAFTGNWIFGIFGITLPAFEIAGGIILMMIALEMLQARRTATKETPEEQAAGMSKDDIAITPLAIPMLSGPGAITAVILLASRASSPAHRIILVLSILIVSLLSFAILRFAAEGAKFFGVITLKIISRLMGLILAAIAVQFILNGISISGAF